jgi:hypothetical protein
MKTFDSDDAHKLWEHVEWFASNQIAFMAASCVFTHSTTFNGRGVIQLNTLYKQHNNSHKRHARDVNDSFVSRFVSRFVFRIIRAAESENKKARKRGETKSLGAKKLEWSSINTEKVCDK